jgi:hypothetical protein
MVGSLSRREHLRPHARDAAARFVQVLGTCRRRMVRSLNSHHTRRAVTNAALLGFLSATLMAGTACGGGTTSNGMPTAPTPA